MTIFINMLLFYFTVFYFMSCLDISGWKAFLMKAHVSKISKIDVTIKEINFKHNT